MIFALHVQDDNTRASTERRGFIARYLILRVLGLLCLVAGFAMAAVPPQRRWTSFEYPPTFEHISVEQGLSQSTVHCILQDRKGFLWFGTDAGLNRYDGFRFQVFHPEKGQANALGGDWILCMLEDSRGDIWIGTRNGGLTILDPGTMTFLPIQASMEAGGLPDPTINALAEDREGNIWIGTDSQGLCRVSKDWKAHGKPRFQVFRSSPLDPRSAPEGSITALWVDPANTLWIGARSRGLGRLTSQSGDTLAFEYFPFDPAHPDTSAPSLVNTITQDAFGLLWLGGDNGPFTFDPARRVFRRWKTVEGDSAPIGNKRVLRILRDSTDTMWVASDGGGLLKALPRSRAEDPVRFRRFAHDPRDPRSLSTNGLQWILEDRSGVLWVSAYHGGLNKLVFNPGRPGDREIPSIFHFRNSAADPSSLSGNTVSAIREDRFGNLWIGTDGFGLNRVVAPTRPGERIRFERYREDSQAGIASIQSDVILTAHLDPKQVLWLGTYDGGLVRVDQASASAPPRFTHFMHDPRNPSSLASNFIRCIVDDDKGGFWIATDGRGLNHFDPRTGKAKRYLWGDGPKVSSSDRLYLMVKDEFGTLWIATPTGLNRFNPVTEEFRVYRPGGEHALSDPFVNTLTLDEGGILWVGTRGGGLCKTILPPWDGPEPRFTTFTTKDGLPGDIVKGIVPDGLGHLWISTGRALCRFDIAQGKGHPFPWQNELRKAEFIWNACYRTQGGEIFFGSNDGLTLFHPGDITCNAIPPPIAIAGFQVFNRPLSLSSRASQTSEEMGIQGIAIRPKDASFSFDFAALHFVAPERNQFAYLLEGLDPAWNEIGNKHSVSYTGLRPGDYVLHVRAANCDGVWGEQEFRLGIKVLPPWYQTWWFRSLLIGTITGLVYLIVWIRIKALRYRNRHLQDLVAARTQELAKANHELADANDALRNQSLTDPLTGLRNRRFLYACMPEDIAQVQRVQRDVAANAFERMRLNIDVLFLMVDLDHFKHVNDHYGHHAGDLVLQQMGEILRTAMRESDTITRWGGEEFLIVARNTARADAVLLPERIRAAVEAHAFEIGKDHTIHCQCSLGFSVFPFLPNDLSLFPWEQVIDIADACLYAAKRGGRNAWVGIVPEVSEIDDATRAVCNEGVESLIQSGLFKPLTSLKTPLRWETPE